MNFNIKKISIVFIIITSFNFSMPVVSVPQVVENVFTEIRNNYETLVTWKREFTEWEQDYKAITEFRLDGNLLNKFSQINNLLKGHGLDMGDLDLSNPKSKIGVLAKQLFDSYTLFKDCEFDFMTADQQRICKDTTVRRVQEMATAKEFQDQVGQMLEKLNDLNTQLRSGKRGTVSNNGGSIEEGSLLATQGEGSGGGSVFDDFSSADMGKYNEMMSSFSDASSETDSDENTIKLSQDVTAGVKSITATVKAMKIQYKLMMMSNKAKEGIDKRQSQQLRMKRFENSEEFYKKSIF